METNNVAHRPPLTWLERLQYERAAKARAARAAKRRRSLERRQSSREKELRAAKQTWHQLLNVRPRLTSAQLRLRVEKISWIGIPPAVRTAAWPELVGNALNIDAGLFAIMRQRAKEVHASLSEVDKANRNTLLSSGEADGTRPTSMLSTDRHSSMKLIGQDLSRTWPRLQFFHGSGPYAAPLREILEAYVCFRPDVGYVQGMSYIAAMLLLYVDTPTAFICLANLLNRNICFDFVRLDSARMQRHLGAFDRVFSEQAPSLHRHFVEQGVQPDMYLLDWILTLFGKSLPLDVAARVYDCIFLHGELFIWRTALGLLRFLAKRLINCEFEELMVQLKSELLTDLLDEDELFRCIRDVAIRPTDFQV